MIRSVPVEARDPSSATPLEGRPGVIPRDPRRWESALHHLTWSFLRLGMKCGHKLTINGAENLPRRGPAIIVANHGSHLDTLLVGSAVSPLLRSKFCPLAAGDTFFRNPFQSWLSSRFLNLRPLWRKQCNPRGLMQLRRTMEAGDRCFLLFPEGTRSRTGAMGRFKPGIGMMVAGTDIPVIPCHIRGAFEAWPSKRALPRRGNLRLEVGIPLTFASSPGTSDDWRKIAQELEAAVGRLGERAAR